MDRRLPSDDEIDSLFEKARARAREHAAALVRSFEAMGLENVERNVNAGAYPANDMVLAKRWVLEQRAPLDKAAREIGEQRAERATLAAERAAAASEKAATASERSANFTRAAAWGSALAAIASLIAVIWPK